MLDRDVKEQLVSIFQPLEGEVGLVYDQTSHSDQAELMGLLSDLSSVNTKIQIKDSGKTSPFPSFRIFHKGRPTGVIFRGIPGGHEFSSLVLAILNSDGKGKLPDTLTVERIRRIKGPIRIRTYISLTCENCPDVVQALNQMALLHPDFQHEMVDGGYVPEEIEKFKIQGVPSVFVDSKMVHSGKINFLDLISKVESAFGTEMLGEAHTAIPLGHYDVVVIGGGPAGSAAAIYSVRKGLKTALLAERIGGQVQDTKGIENFISIPYTEGPQLSAHLYEHLKAYPVEIFEPRRVKTIVSGPTQKRVDLESGEYMTADSVIVTTGAKWRELGVPGERNYLGRGVAFCPTCDGPFYKGKKVAVIGGGNSGIEAAIDLAGIVSEVVVLEFQPDLKADKVLIEKLKTFSNVSVITNAKTEEILGDGNRVTGLKYEDRAKKQSLNLALDGVFVQIGLVPNSQFLKGVVELTKFGEIVVDSKGKTSVPGIYAAGDVTNTPFKQIVIAMGEGAKVALAVFEDRMFKASVAHG